MSELFFRAIDAAWAPRPALRLYVIGCTALKLQTSYGRNTKDADILEAQPMDGSARSALLAIAGKGTSLAVRHRMYLEFVPAGLPFLPPRPNWKPVPRWAPFTTLEVSVLDVVDVAVSKLLRFHADDQADIDGLIELGELPHDAFISRFRAATDPFLGDARSADLPTIVRNLHYVEESMFGRSQGTPVDLPDWLDC